MNATKYFRLPDALHATRWDELEHGRRQVTDNQKEATLNLKYLFSPLILDANAR
jgi:hypothetical protein